MGNVVFHGPSRMQVVMVALQWCRVDSDLLVLLIISVVRIVGKFASIISRPFEPLQLNPNLSRFLEELFEGSHLNGEKRQP